MHIKSILSLLCFRNYLHAILQHIYIQYVQHTVSGILAQDMCGLQVNGSLYD